MWWIIKRLDQEIVSLEREIEELNDFVKLLEEHTPQRPNKDQGTPGKAITGISFSKKKQVSDGIIDKYKQYIKEDNRLNRPILYPKEWSFDGLFMRERKSGDASQEESTYEIFSNKGDRLPQMREDLLSVVEKKKRILGKKEQEREKWDNRQWNGFIQIAKWSAGGGSFGLLSKIGEWFLGS